MGQSMTTFKPYCVTRLKSNIEKKSIKETHFGIKDSYASPT